MESYRVACPVCDAKSTAKIEIPDTGVIYNIQGFDSEPNLLWSWKRPDPEATTGADVLIDRGLVDSVSTQCDNGHHLVVRSCHYGELDTNKTVLHGPAEKPKVRCPRCEYKIGDHAEFIYRGGTEPNMQYILRTITIKSDSAYHYVGSITRSTMGEYNQLSTIRQCKGCGLDIHFNYSNKVYQDNEKYDGFKKQLK